MILYVHMFVELCVFFYKGFCYFLFGLVVVVVVVIVFLVLCVFNLVFYVGLFICLSIPFFGYFGLMLGLWAYIDFLFIHKYFL